jgi:shikimate kinase
MSETITSSQFDEQLNAGKLVLSIVAMSNSGKSFWAKRLALENDFTHVCCDDEIESQLTPLLKAEGYNGGIEDVANWMGQPYEVRSAINQQRYLALENAVMEDTVGRLENGDIDGNIVVDTTGSVVHTHPEILTRLGSLSTIVYLKSTPSMQKEMFNRYITKPKPVIWGDAFEPSIGESQVSALERCYPNLITLRSGMYAAAAHVTLPCEVTRNLTDASEFLDKVREVLPVS